MMNQCHQIMKPHLGKLRNSSLNASLYHNINNPFCLFVCRKCTSTAPKLKDIMVIQMELCSMTLR